MTSRVHRRCPATNVAGNRNRKSTFMDSGFRFRAGGLRVFVAAISISALSTSAVAQTSPSGLVVEGKDGVIVYGPTRALFDFGTVDPLTTPRLEHLFTLKNGGTATLTVGNLMPSCGCTTALIGSGDEQSRTLAPGAEASVRTVLDVAHSFGGMLDKYVTVYLQGQSVPAAVLELRVNVRPLISFSRPLIGFGQVPTGETRSIDLTATVDARLASGGVLPKLASSDPDVTVAPSGGQTETLRDGKPMLAQSYTCTVSPHAHLGVLNGTVYFLVRPSTTPRPEDALASFSVPFSGEVTGKISAAPATVMFGAAAVGREVTRTVTITGVNPEAVRGLHLGDPGPWLTAKMEPPAADRPNQAALQVTLTSHAPTGSIQSHVDITTTDGQRLVVPVIAYVVPVPK